MDKKIAILVGKFNEITKEVSNCLSEKYYVQLASESKDILSGIIQISKPDLVVFLLTGISSYPTDIVGLFVKECPYVPIVVVGNSEDEKDLKDKGFLLHEWISFMKRPVKAEKICARADDLMAMEFKNGKPTAPPKVEKPLILLVDDSASQLRYMHALLSRKYKVNFATSGFQAISSIAKNSPDLILLDYEMPVMDGKQTLQMLRSEESTRNIPVIFLTGTSDSIRVIEAFEHHPQGYLLKPCSEEKLFGTIEEVLEECKGKPFEEWTL